MRNLTASAALLLTLGSTVLAACGSGNDTGSTLDNGSGGGSGDSTAMTEQGGGAGAGGDHPATAGSGGGGSSAAKDAGSVTDTGGNISADDGALAREAEALVPVANCGKLPGPDAGWHNITPPQMAMLEALSVIVDPYDQTVYAAADTSTTPGTGVLRSSDCGATWSLASTGQNADTMKSGGLWAMMIEPAPHNAPTIYAANGYGNGPTIYRSTNGGVDFAALDPDPDGVINTGLPFVHTIAMDPNDPAHIAVGFHDNCKAPHSPLCFSRSLDRGAAWQVFDGPRDLGGWEEGASINILGPSSYLYLGNHGTYYTSDEGKTWTHVNGSAIYCCYGGITLRLPDGSLLAPIGNGTEGLWLSRASANSPLGASFSHLAGTPDQIVSLITDGKRVFAGRGYFNLTQPYWSASLTDLTKWTQMVTPTITRSPNQMAFDPVHHVIYSANWRAGLWRLVTE